MLFLPPIACTIFATALLHLSWRGATPNRAATTAIGWLFLFGSLALWVSAAGARFAPLLAALALPLATWLLAPLNQQHSEQLTTTLSRRSALRFRDRTSER